VSRPGRALPPGKGTPVPIEQEAGWAPDPVWTQMLEEKSFRLCQGSNLDRSAVQPDTIMTELPGFQQIKTICMKILIMIHPGEKRVNWKLRRVVYMCIVCQLW
jgi:hypothetical protein